MELRANLPNEYRLYKSICYTGKMEEEISNNHPVEAEFLNICKNVVQRRLLFEKMAPELNGSLLYLFLNQKCETLASPFWQYTILHYKQPIHPKHLESDRWVLSLEMNQKILQQISLLQIQTKARISSDDRIEVLCLGAGAVAGLPELRQEAYKLSICCIESDEMMIYELQALYANDPGIRKIVKGDFQHYYPDRKYDVIIYPSGKTWPETEKMQTLLLKFRNYLKPERGRVLAY